MSDAENVEKSNIPNSPSESIEKLDQKETFTGSPEHADPAISEDGKPFVGMEGELDFEVLSPEKTERLEDQSFSLPNEVDSQASMTGEIEKTGKETSLIAEKGNELKTHGIEDGEDDGECSDDEDLEEGEVKDENEPVTKARQICRFFNRGMCFYGIQCRFLHLNNDMKGNYNMFSPTPPRVYETAHMSSMMVPPGQHGIIHRSAPRSGPDFIPIPPLLPAPVEQQESAWEKGLREAKELLKKANQRKEEPDFEEKRLTLSLSSSDRNTQINDKENDKFGYKKKNREDLYKYGDPAYNKTHFGSRYENFEIRYTNVDRGIRSRRRAHGERRFNQREDSTGHWRNGDRMEDMEKIRAEAYFDPWRRSKSPKHRRSKDRERSRSFGGSPFSSVSSYSSRSSSYSRSSSSMSRGLSSRSPSPMSDKKKKTPANKSLYPLSPKETPNKLNAAVKGKKKSGARTSSSRSRSISRGRSLYSSRSSRSLSMDSVSSASSSISHSSSGESSGRPEHASILRRQDEKPTEREKPEVLPPPGNNYYFQLPRSLKSEKIKDTDIGIPDADKDPLEESFQMSQADTSTLQPTVQHLMPERERAKDPLKGLHPPKQQIKLTLLNKVCIGYMCENNIPDSYNLPKKELEGNKGEETSKLGGFLHGVKRPLSPPVPPAAAKPQPAFPKKSASSRRDELLKQLKAVEDAIARKRAKFC
ncbi:Zinc finger CCCH domain-containing protein 18 [Argiope bruennichi]|uniref:Zinc finger CCCH domain-containing protein 18 n=1 Tax=Argiope bruennichi TaxID=94029 RepID=A0A8T0FAM9_ARGBR|nr:Zinc finger CCCH domain-containing protein 18 [Argiope bruennichi]